MANLIGSQKTFSWLRLAPVMTLTLALGIVVVLVTMASGPLAVFEAESGIISGGAVIQTLTGASGGQVVKFVSATTSPPTPTATPTGTRSLNCAPSTSATMTNTVSHLCGFPDTTNTGVTAGATLKRVPQDITAPDSTTGSGWHYDSRGWIAVDTAGAVIQNIDTALNIDVTANNVTVKHVRVHTGNDMFGISVRHTTNVVISDSEISGGDSGANRLMVAVKDIYADSVNLQVLRNNIYYVSTGIQMDAGLIQDNYIHDMGLIDGDHINGTTSNGGTTLLTLRHNTSFNQFSQTDAISLFQDFGVQANKVIDNNLVAGGGYTIYGGGGAAISSNIKITNNHFSRMFYSNSGGWGPVAAYDASGSGNVWSGNIWDDTGATVGP